MPNTTERKDVYTRITEQIVGYLEKGVRPWTRPWNAEHAAGRITRPLRHNGQPYSGINVLSLWASALSQDFAAPIWMTFRRASELKAHVRKGEKGSLVVYANAITRTEHNDKTGEDVEREIPYMKGYKLRITILKGIQRSNPAAYRVFVSTNIDPSENQNSLVAMVGRQQTMMPLTTENLEAFLKTFNQSGRYLLAPAHFISETKLPDIGLGLAILKSQLIVRNAWEIPLNDIDATAFNDEDDPCIPPDVKDAPVTALLAAIREFAKRKQ